MTFFFFFYFKNIQTKTLLLYIDLNKQWTKSYFKS